MKQVLKNGMTLFVLTIMFLIIVGTENYAALVCIPLCFILVYYNYIRNIESNASFQKLFVENSEQKLKLLKSDAELSTFFKITPNILAIASLGQFKRVSDNFIKALGYTNDEIINQPFFNFIHPDDHQKTIDIIAQAQGVDNVFMNFVNRYRAKDGHYVTIKWSAILVDNTFYVSGNDITNEVKFDVLFNKIDIPLCIFDNQRFLFTSVNYAFASKLGYDESEMIGRHLSDFIHNEDFADSLAASESDVKVQGYKNRYISKNGEIKTLSWSTLGDDERFIYCTAEFLN